MDEVALIEYFGARQEDMLEALALLVQHESPSADKLLLDALARQLQQRFSQVGAAATVLPNPEGGDHVRVEFTPEQVIPSDARPALLLCHFDTVWPVGTLKTRPFRIEGERALGPGIYDMKGGIVLAEFALRAVVELGLQLPRPVVVLLNSDEEVGSTTSRALIEAEARKAAYVLVLEPALPGGVLKTARKGVGRFLVQVEGKAAHSGADPEKGISAIHELAHQILHLYDLNDLEGGTTISVGVVRGGTKSNVVPAYAEAEVDVRAVTQAEADRITEAIRGIGPQISGTRVQVSGGFNRPPMERGPTTVTLFQRAQGLGRRLGLELEEGMTGGGSDGNFTAAMGIPTLDGLGVVGDGAHAEHEHILVDALPARAGLLTSLLVQF